MQIIIDTANPLTETERNVLALLIGQNTTFTVEEAKDPVLNSVSPSQETVEEAPKPKATRTRKTAEPKPEEVEETVEETVTAEDIEDAERAAAGDPETDDVLDEDALRDEAVKVARAAMKADRVEELKEALSELGVKRVTELAVSDLSTFIEKLA